MKKNIYLLPMIFFLSFNAYAEMSLEELSKYRGVISCIDRSFFDGGYTEGDADRLKMMNFLLSKMNLPSYEEKLKEQEIKIDTDSYMLGYESCDSNWDLLETEAKKIGIEPEDGW